MQFQNLNIEGFEHYKVNKLGDVFNTLNEKLYTNNGIVTHVILINTDGYGKSFAIRDLVKMILMQEKEAV